MLTLQNMVGELLDAVCAEVEPNSVLKVVKLEPVDTMETPEEQEATDPLGTPEQSVKQSAAQSTSCSKQAQSKTSTSQLQTPARNREAGSSHSGMDEVGYSEPSYF